MRLRPRFRTLALAAAALLLAGCSTGNALPDPSTSPPAPSTSAPAPSTGAQPASPAAPALAAAKSAAGIADCPRSDPDVEPLPDGLPDLTLACLGGGRDVRLAGLRGRPMLINVWAQWCGPCREEAPFLAEAAQQYGDELLVLGVDYVDPRPAYAIEFARVANWRFPQLVDPERRLQAPLRIVGPPLTVLVTADGRIAHTQRRPFTSTEQIRDLVAEHLGVTA